MDPGVALAQRRLLVDEHVGRAGDRRAHAGVRTRRAAVRVGGRRWNVQLDDSIEVKLPEDDAAGAWTRLAEVERKQGILKRDLAAVDLRLPDRLVVTLPTDVIARPKPGRKPGTAGKDHET